MSKSLTFQEFGRIDEDIPTSSLISLHALRDLTSRMALTKKPDDEVGQSIFVAYAIWRITLRKSAGKLCDTVKWFSYQVYRLPAQALLYNRERLWARKISNMFTCRKGFHFKHCMDSRLVWRVPGVGGVRLPEMTLFRGTWGSWTYSYSQVAF